MTDASFGARLRRERERRQIALSSIAANTKISVGLFQGLERGDVSRWPSGIFRRAFIRAYAEGVGLDAAAVTREFLELFPEPGAEAFPAPRQHADPDASDLRLALADEPLPIFSGPRPGGLRRSLAAAWDVGAVLALGLLLFVALDAFWMSIGISALCYYPAAVLLLGDTPGVCVAARGFTRRQRDAGNSAPPSKKPARFSHFRVFQT